MSPRDISPGCHSLPLGNEPRWWRMPYEIREAGIRSAHGLHPSTRSLMFEAAATVDLDPDRLSFTGCFQILKCRLPECQGKTPAELESWYKGILWEIQGERTEPRHNRINPRVIKRKMSKWKKKRPQHRRLPPLKKALETQWL